MGIKLEPNKLREKVVEMVFNAKSGHIEVFHWLKFVLIYIQITL